MKGIGKDMNGAIDAEEPRQVTKTMRQGDGLKRARYHRRFAVKKMSAMLMDKFSSTW